MVKSDEYTVFSLWDTFRAAHPLYTIIDQKRTVDFINTFHSAYTSRAGGCRFGSCGARKPTR